MTQQKKTGKSPKSEIEKIVEENETMKEVLTDLKTIQKSQLQYAKDSANMFKEEQEGFFYTTIVFQNNAAATEFTEKFKEFMGIRDGRQIFVNGHELAEKWGKPLKTPYVKKTVNIDKLRDAKLISEVGVFGK